MKSNINPDSINIDFPIANTDNLSQGFRDNFIAIQEQLATAAQEISRLQNLQVSVSGVTQSPPTSLGDGSSASPSIVTSFVSTDLAHSIDFPGTGAIRVPVGDTAQRPASAPLNPAAGMIRYNTDINNLEFYQASSSSWKPIQSSGNGSGGSSGSGATGPTGPQGSSSGGGNGGNSGLPSPAGPNRSIQYNDGGVLGGNSGFIWDGNQAVAHQILAGQVQINTDTITNVLESGILNLNSRGNISDLSVSTAGSGYISVPAITIAPPSTSGGIQATARAHMGAVMAVPYDRGAGYVVGDILTVVGGTFTTPTTLLVDTARIKNNPVVDPNNRGIGYKPNDLLIVAGGSPVAPATLLVTNVQLINPQIISSGYGYTTGDVISVFGGNGSRVATASVVAYPIAFQLGLEANGTTSSFNLNPSLSDSKISDLFVTVSGKTQTLNVDYSITGGNTLVFTKSPSAGSIINVTLGGQVESLTMVDTGSYDVLPNTLMNLAVLTNPAGSGSGVGLIVSYSTCVDTVQIQDQGPYYSLPTKMQLNPATGGSGSGALFNLTSEINTVAIQSIGDYSAISQTLLINNAVTGGTGTGATVNLSFGLARAEIVNHGTQYTGTPNVTVDPSPSGNNSKIKPIMTGSRVNIGDLFVSGKSFGTAPRVSNNLWVTMDGDDSNDGTAEDRAFRTIKAACAAAEEYTTIFVRSGNYVEQNPIFVPSRVSIIGDNLRRVNLYYGNPTQDFFWVNNACYIAGVSFRGGQAPGYAISFPPTGAGKITTSPYIQNCTAFNSTGGGMKVDGNLASGLKSMVLDAFTQFNQGGHGIHVLNQGYAQLVSIFTICCDIGTLIESGGTCSVNNSNTSFGAIGMKADGLSPYLFGGKVRAGTGKFNSGTVNIENIPARPYVGLVATVGREFCYVNNVEVLDQGVGYKETPIVVFDPPIGYAGQQAQATASVTSTGTIDKITVVSSGGGYTGKATVTIQDISGNGAIISYVTYTAQAVPTILTKGSGYKVGDIIYISGGSFPDLTNNTPTQLQVTRVGAGGVVTSISFNNDVTNPGGIYTDLPLFSGASTTTSGIGSGFTCSISYGVRKIELASPGFGYTNPTVYISGPGGITTLGTCDIDESTGTVVNVNIINQGGGYVSQPEIKIQGGGGTDWVETSATAVSIVKNGSVVGVRITNPGSNFVLDPNISFSGGGGAGAKAGACYYQVVNVSIDTLTTTTGNTFVAGGTGYKINDLILVSGGVVAPNSLPARILVTGISNDGLGSVTSISLDRAGVYSGMPPINGADTTADTTLPVSQRTAGVGCRVILSMGLAAIKIQNGGSGYTPGPRIRFVGGGAQSVSFNVGQEYFAITDTPVITNLSNVGSHLINAIEYIKVLTSRIVKNAIAFPTPTSTILNFAPFGPNQTTVSQITDVSLSTDPVASTVSEPFFDFITGFLQSNSPSITSYDNAQTLLQKNRGFLQAEVAAYVSHTYPTLLNAEQLSLCARDVGYIVDAISIDCSVGGYIRSIRAGERYWNGATSLVAGQQSQTVDALNYLNALAQKVVTNPDYLSNVVGYSGYPYQTSVLPVVNQTGLSKDGKAAGNVNSCVSIINYIIQNGIEQTHTKLKNSSQLLRANKQYIQEEVLAYVKTMFDSDFNMGDSELESWAQNIGTIVEAVATDLVGGGGVPAQALADLYPIYYTVDTATPLVNNGGSINLNPVSGSLSTRSGTIYNPSASVIPNEQTQTVAAISYLSTIAQRVVSQQNVISNQSVASQVFDSSSVINNLSSVNLAVRSLLGVISLYISNGTADVKTNLAQARSLLQQNITFLQTEIIAYVKSQYPTILANSQMTDLCSRDVGLLVNAVGQDIISGGLSNSINAGRSYWNGSTSDIPGQVDQIQATITYLSQLCASVISNTAYPIQNLYSNASQVIANSLSTGYSSNYSSLMSSFVQVSFGLINSVISEKGSIYSYANAAKSLRENKTFLQEQVSSYVSTTYPSLLTPYQLSLCKRDVGFLVDSVAGDLVGAGYKPLPYTTNSVTTLELDEVLPYVPLDGETINFYQVSMSSVSSHQFEFVGAGTDINTCLPSLGGVPVQKNEVVMTNGGRIYYTSTDQRGDFRIGPGLVINQNSGTLSGRTFEKSLFGLITPFILSIEATSL